MITSFNIPALFQQYFGFKPQFDAQDLPTPAISGALGSPFYQRDALGRNYFMPVRLNGVELPLPVIRISGRKNIVETSLVNRQGTVKELISSDDYRISIRGICLGDGSNWPEEQITMLEELFKLNQSVKISNVLTDIFLVRPDRSGSDSVVITDLTIMETKGFKGVVPYSMELVSDAEFELIIK